MLLGWLLLLPAVRAQEATPEPEQSFRVVRVDTAAFPDMALYLAPASLLQPLPDDLTNLTLHEAGVLLPDIRVTPMPVGLDLIVVIDANESITTLDEGSDMTRLEKVQRSLLRFATDFMDAQGQDRVSVIVPDETGENGRFLLQNATTPSDVVDGVLAYAPETVGPTPLAAMLNQAITQAVQMRDENGRFQAILLFTDGGQLDRQLDFAALNTQMQTARVPVFAAILGARADPNEIANVTQLTDPSGGDYLHMPEAEAADLVYELWQPQREQVQIGFTSMQSSTGQYTVDVTLGETAVSVDYTITIEPPIVDLLLQPGDIVRQSFVPDATEADLQPTTLALPLVVTWPDGAARQLTAVSLLVDGELVMTLPDPTPDASGGLVLNWNLRNVSAGAHELVLTVTDVLGLTVSSEPVSVTLVLNMPPTATPDPSPASTPVSAETAVTTVVADNPALVGIAIGLLLLVGVLLWVQRRLRRGMESVDLADELADIVVSDKKGGRHDEPEPPVSAPPLVAYLEWLDTARDPIRLQGESITIGRDPETADLVIDDQSISPLHARIKRSGDAYWLYDEGSTGGTYLNFDRLGLGPRMLHDQNRVQLGHVRLLFRLQPDEIDEPEEGEPEAG
ncbi:MAG: FHA domain-containing protein [Ardenticatenaceae bacterium]|nr:FHA domain-containing protein [Ardenticatenaceae bacterium]